MFSQLFTVLLFHQFLVTYFCYNFYFCDNFFSFTYLFQWQFFPSHYLSLILFSSNFFTNFLFWQFIFKTIFVKIFFKNLFVNIYFSHYLFNLFFSFFHCNYFWQFLCQYFSSTILITIVLHFYHHFFCHNLFRLVWLNQVPWSNLFLFNKSHVDKCA